jgi:hypothetical protein
MNYGFVAFITSQQINHWTNFRFNRSKDAESSSTRESSEASPADTADAAPSTSDLESQQPSPAPAVGTEGEPAMKKQRVG